MATWEIENFGTLSITNNQVCFVDHYTKWKYTSDMPYFEYVDPAIIPNIIQKSIRKYTIQIENNKEEVNITVPYKIYGKENKLYFKLALIEKYIIDKVEVAQSIITLQHKLDNLMKIFQDNETILLFPTIDPVDFIKFVKMYCIFEELPAYKNKQGQDIPQYLKHTITHNYRPPNTNEIIFNNGRKDHTGYGSDNTITIDLNVGRLNLINIFVEHLDKIDYKWCSRVICSYLSLKYMYNYKNGVLMNKNKKYMYLSNNEWTYRFNYDTTKYKYIINEEHAKIYDNNIIIHEVVEFEKW